jgi:GNAT superfamily N-acetyltransferase
MAAYFNGDHHPRQAETPRIGYVALSGDQAIGYVAGHRTKRNGCDGEVQYLFVAPAFRRLGIGAVLLRLLAEWFRDQGVQKVCVAVANDSPREAKPFMEAVGAVPLKKHWYAWEDIRVVPPGLQPKSALQ